MTTSGSPEATRPTGRHYPSDTSSRRAPGPVGQPGSPPFARVVAPVGYVRLGGETWHVLVHRRGAWAVSLLTVLLIALSAVSLASGSAAISAVDALRAAFGQGSTMTVFLIQELRLPRLIAGLLTGAAFGVGGCLLQTLARNRLATPGIIGIDDGASAFAIASIVAVPTSLAPSFLA